MSPFSDTNPFSSPKNLENPGDQHNPAGGSSTSYVKFFTNTSLVLRRSYSNILTPSWGPGRDSSVVTQSRFELPLRLFRPGALRRYNPKMLDPLVTTIDGTQRKSEETSDTEILRTE